MTRPLLALFLLSAVCFADNLPDPKLTPGATVPGVSIEQVCRPGYAGSVRHVTQATKRLVFRRYGIPNVPGKYEVDHLISLELGGSNDVTNLWPEPYEPKPGAHEKDLIENELHRRVCSGEMGLDEAQLAIRTDWLSFYEQWEKEKAQVPPETGVK